MTKYATTQQYEPLRTPSNWSREERVLVSQLTDRFDDLYSRFNRLRFEDLGKVLQGAISGKVDNDTFQTSVTQTADQIEQKASQETVDTLGQTVAQHSTSITQNAQAITQKASQETVNTLTGRVTTAESNITQVPGQISLAVANFKIGCTNYVPRGSLLEDVTPTWWIKNSGTENLVFSTTSGICVQFDPDAVPTQRNGIRSAVDAIINGLLTTADETVTISFETRNWAGTSGQVNMDYVWILSATDGVGNLLTTGSSNNISYENLTVSSDWRKTRITFSNKNVYTGVSQLYSTGFRLIIGTAYYNTSSGYENVGFYIRNIKLERGEKATDWSPAILDPVAGVKTSSVEVNTEGVYVKSTGEFNVAAGAGVDIDTTNLRIRNGDRELLTVDETSVRIGADILDAPVIVGNVANTFAGGTIPWKGSISASLNNIGKWLLATSTLTVPAGTYGGASIRGFKGARLSIKLSSGVTIRSTIGIYHCDDVYIYADNVDTAYIIPETTGGTFIIYATTCKRLHFYKINMSGGARTSAADGTQYGLYAASSTVIMDSCCIDKTCSGAARIQEASIGYFTNCFGGVVGGSNPATVANLGYGVRPMTGSYATVYQNTFASVSNDAGFVSQVYSTNTTQTGTTGTTPAAPATRTYAVSAGYTAKDTTSGGSSVSWSSGEPRQGSWVEYIAHPTPLGNTYIEEVLYYGFGVLILTNAANIVSDRPSGKTIASARMTIRRDATAGTANTISCTLYQHNLTSSPSGAPNTLLSSAAADAVSIGPGEEQTITLNASAISNLNNGTCKGIGWRSSGGYGRYDIYGELEVTYSV